MLTLLAETIGTSGTDQALTNTNCVDNGVATLSCIPYVIQNILFWLFALAGIAAIVFVIYGGIKFVLSGGDPKQVDGARKTITYALIGLALILSAFVIINLIGTITGATCIGKIGIGNCG